jgi:hypothetical protein
MDRWKSRGGKRQRREEKRRREKIKEDQRRDGAKVGSLKRRVRSHVVR